VRPTSDLAELRGIHHWLFQDLYEWAGQTRTVDLRKPGSAPFLPASRIELGTRFVFDELRSDNYLCELTRGEFVDRLAHHYDSLNYAHPFREGNGRTQRAFWSRVARDAGWTLDWRSVTSELNNEASRAAVERSDLGPLRAMFDAITEPGGRRGPQLDARILVLGTGPSTSTPHNPRDRTRKRLADEIDRRQSQLPPRDGEAGEVPRQERGRSR
jgi:cell filamentation protein